MGSRGLALWTTDHSEDKQLSPLTRKNMRCCSPFPDSLLRLPRRMNSCGESRPGWERANLGPHRDSGFLTPWSLSH